MDAEEQAARVAMSRVTGVGGATLRRLVERFDSAQDVLAATDADLRGVARITPEIVHGLRAASAALETVRDEIALLAEEEIAVLTWEELPPNLRAAHDAPALLYVRGRFSRDDDLAVAVVGSRAASEEGIQAAHRVAAGLSERGVTVVSGLAAGIDSAAHRGALDAGGRTIGVLGSGVRKPPPGIDGEAAAAMIERGAVVSELAPNTRVNPRQLMMRDRIVSGLSLAVIIVEAAVDSGTMDTAQRARRQERPVFVLDWGGDDDRAAGNRSLLQAGARPLAPADLDWDAVMQECDAAAQLVRGPRTYDGQPSLF